MNSLYLPDHQRMSSEVSTDSDSFTKKPTSGRKMNPKLEGFRNSIKSKTWDDLPFKTPHSKLFPNTGE